MNLTKGDPNIRHSKDGWLSVAIQMPGKSPVFKWQLNSRLNCLVLRCLVTFHYWDGDLNNGLLVRYSDHGLITGPFDDRTGFDHLNTGLVCHSDPHCICELIAFYKKAFYNKGWLYFVTLVWICCRGRRIYSCCLFFLGMWSIICKGKTNTVRIWIPEV